MTASISARNRSRRVTLPGAYLRAAGIAVRGRGRPGEESPKPAISTGEVSTDSARPWPPPGRAPCASACEPYRELIVDALGRGPNAMAIWQDLVDDHCLAARYASVRRFVRQLHGCVPVDARVVITTDAPVTHWIAFQAARPFSLRSCANGRLQLEYLQPQADHVLTL